MRRFLRYAIQYAILATAGYFIYQTAFTRGAPPNADRATWSQRQGFVALSYGGLSVDEHEPSLIGKERLRAHLQALHQAGYRTITTADVRNFYEADKPLPEKALYLMFEGGRKDSVLFSQPALQETGFHASLYVYGSHLSGWNRFFVRARELHKIADNPFWDVDTMGFHSELINFTPQGGYAHYLTARLDGPNGTPDETQEAFDARVAADFRQAYQAIDEATGIPPLGYIFVPANTLGVSLPAALTAPIEKNLTATFPVAFTRVGDTYNSRDSDPRALTRMQVGSDWSADRLLLEIEARLPRSRYLDFSNSVRQGLWQIGVGDIAADGQSLTLTAPAGHEPFAKLRGSEGFENFQCQVATTPTAETASLVYLRYRNSGSFARIQVTPDKVSVQEKNGTSLNTIFQYVLPLDHTGPVRLCCCVKANRLLLRVDGKDVSPYPIPLTAETSRGFFALGALGDTGPRTATFTDLRLETFLPHWVQVPDVHDLAPDAARTLTGLILPATALTEDPVGDAAALVAIAAQGVGPYLDLSGADAAKVTETVNFVHKAPAAMVFAKLLRGFVLSFDAFPEAKGLAGLMKMLQNKGFSVVLRLSGPAVARLAALHDTLSPDWLLFDVPPAEDDHDMAVLKNHYDRLRMLLRVPGPAQATTITYEVKR